MAERWYAHATDGSLPLVVDALRAMRPGANVILETHPVRLRTRIAEEQPGSISVVIGPRSKGISSINLAAAIAADGTAEEVVLVADEADDELRAAASQAGISKVLTRSDIEQAVRAGKDAESAGSSPALAPARSGSEKQPQHFAVQPGGKGGAVLCLASGRGGVGKSALAAAMASCASAWGLDTALVDLDLAGGSLHSFFGLPAPADLGALAEGEASADAVAAAGIALSEGLSLWGPCKLPEMAERASGIVEPLLDELARTKDLVIVDTASTWTDAAAQAVQTCDRLMLVSDERPGAASSLARMASLAVRLGVARTRIMRIANRCDARKREEPFLFRANIGLETARAFQIYEGGGGVSELLSFGHAAELMSLDGDFADSVAFCLANTLSELGRLPADEAARKALAMQLPRRSRGLLARMREAV